MKLNVEELTKARELVIKESKENKNITKEKDPTIYELFETFQIAKEYEKKNHSNIR